MHFPHKILKPFQKCLFGRVTVDIDTPRKPFSAYAKQRLAMVFDVFRYRMLFSEIGTINLLY